MEDAELAPLRYRSHYGLCLFCAGEGCLGCDGQRAIHARDRTTWPQLAAYYCAHSDEVSELRRVLERNDIGRWFSDQDRYDILSYIDEVNCAAAACSP